MTYSLKEISIQMPSHTVRASYYGPRHRCAILLHGGGNSNSQTIFPLRVDLANHGIGTLALDHYGHGQTGGDIGAASLKQRVEEAAEVISKADPPKIVGAVSMSMGGYVSIKLQELVHMPSLVLIAPAVYDATAYSMQFGDGFSDVIRKENSWKKSDAFQLINNFKGRFLLIYGAEDNVIPEELTKRIAISRKASEEEVLRLDGIDHFVMTRLREGKAETLQFVINSIVRTLVGQ